MMKDLQQAVSQGEMSAEQLLFSLIRTVVCSTPAEEGLVAACQSDRLMETCRLAQQHDLLHLVGEAFSRLPLPESEGVVYLGKRAALRAFQRWHAQKQALDQLSRVLEAERIPFLPLKGAVMRDYYPEAWMRTGSDLDVLVKEEDLDRAVEKIMEHLPYQWRGKGDHDVCLKGPHGVWLELHYDTIQERYEVNGCRRVLSRIWEEAVPVAEGAFCHRLSSEMFRFYHLAHMAKHLETGGCGIRAFLDLWVINHRIEPLTPRGEALLREGGLFLLEQGASHTAEVWFSGAEANETSRLLERYVLKAGLFGNNENRAAAGQAKNGGRLRYLLTKRIFLPYSALKAEYPILKKHPWLFPLFQPVRWGRMIRSGGLHRTAVEWKANTHSSQEQIKEAKALWRALGL